MFPMVVNLSIFQVAGMEQAGFSNQLADHDNRPGCSVNVSNQIENHVDNPSECLVNDEDTSLSAVLDTTSPTIQNQVQI